MMVSDIKNTALELGLAQVRSNYTIPAGETFSITVEGDVPAISANEHGFCSITYIPIAAADYRYNHIPLLAGSDLFSLVAA